MDKWPLAVQQMVSKVGLRIREERLCRKFWLPAFGQVSVHCSSKKQSPNQLLSRSSARHAAVLSSIRTSGLLCRREATAAATAAAAASAAGAQL